MIIPVIIAGGKGQRLWPCSTDARPKPFISLAGETTTLFQNTVERLAYLPVCEAPIIVCHAEQEMLARDQAEASGTPPTR